MGMLSGYRMLDLGRFMAAPFAAHMLADMGMDVIKVEEPEPRAGMARDVLTPYLPTPEGERKAAAYNALARNKKSIALDLLRPELRPRSQEVFHRLVRDADVVLEGYRPGVVKWMGIDYDTLAKINPRIICCSLSGYGQDGPYAKYPGHAGQFGAVGGAVNLSAEGEPGGAVGAAAGYVNGLYAANAILGALLERERSGVGQYIDVSMLGVLMSMTMTDSVRYLRDGVLPAPQPRRTTGLAYLQCADGKWITTGNAETSFWEAFCTVIARPQYIPLQRGQGAEFDAMLADIQALFKTKTRAEWLPLLWTVDAAVAPMNDVAEAFEDPQVRHVGMAWELQHPTEGAVRQIGSPMTFSRTPVEFERFAPILGEHTHEVLASAGYTAAEITRLEGEGIVKSWTGDGWVGETRAPGAPAPAAARS